MTAMLNKKSQAFSRKKRITDPKSCDYLSWFYCSGERSQSQMAFLLRQNNGPDLWDLRSDSGFLRHVPSPIQRRRKVIPPSGPGRLSDRDLVEIIKRARSRAQRKGVVRDTCFTANRAVDTIDHATMGTFIGGAAHHFNNLFMVIQGNISLMALEMDEDPSALDKLKRIENLIQSESILTNDLMGYEFAGQCRADPNCQVTLLENVFSIAAALTAGEPEAQSSSDGLFQDFVGGFTRIMTRLLDDTMGLAQDLIAHTPVESSCHPRFRTILYQLDKGFELIESLQEYLGLTHEDTHTVDSKILIETLIDACFQPASRVRFHLSLDQNLAPIKADPQLIAKIIHRLVQNSSEALSDGGDIYLEARNIVPRAVIAPGGCVRSGRVVLISLSDTGPGIDPEVAHRIFDPFFTTRWDKGSAGLGLASVRGMLRSIGGSIRCCPQRGPGAAFEIYLPAAVRELIGQ